MADELDIAALQALCAAHPGPYSGKSYFPTGFAWTIGEHEDHVWLDSIDDKLDHVKQFKAMCEMANALPLVLDDLAAAATQPRLTPELERSLDAMMAAFEYEIDAQSDIGQAVARARFRSASLLAVGAWLPCNRAAKGSPDAR